MVDQVAAAIFGTADGHVQLRVISAADRIPLLQAGDVDIVARNMTINCSRWEQIAFSAEYFHSGQKVLVESGSGITEVADLAGKRVCAPAGTTSLDQIQEVAPDAIAVSAVNHTGCLLKFQNGRRTPSPATTRCSPGWSPRTRTPRCWREALTDSPTASASTPTTSTWCASSTRCSSGPNDDGSWQASYKKWLQPSLGVPYPADPLYGR